MFMLVLTLGVCQGYVLIVGGVEVESNRVHPNYRVLYNMLVQHVIFVVRYGLAHPRLVFGKHSQDWPSCTYLRTIISSGCMLLGAIN